MNKKNLIIVVVLIILFVGLVVVIKLQGSEDAWICQDGQWIKRGYPGTQKPIEPCEVAAPAEEQEVILETLRPNELIASPLEIRGQARGYWYFEASFPIRLLDGSGRQIALAIAQAQSDWMTTDFVEFKATLDFLPPETATGKLILEKDNPSGLPEHAKQIEIPIQFLEPQTAQVKIFFNNSGMDPEFTCQKVFPVNREIKIFPGQHPARAAVEELLKGPLAEEKDSGYLTSINEGVKIQSLTIDPPAGGGIAKIDFDDQLEFQVGGSCRVAAIHWQIVETLKQFNDIQNVVISINGRTEDILQP